MALCDSGALLQSAATSGFPKLSARNKIDVLLQLLCNVSNGQGMPIELGMAVTDEVLSISTGTNKLTLRSPAAFTLTHCKASLRSASSGADVLVGITVGGVSILSSPITIVDGDTTSEEGGPAPVISSPTIGSDSLIGIDITQVGSVVAGVGLKVWMLGTRT